MSATFDLAEAIVKFTSCTETNWDNFNLPIPQNVVIVTVDTKKFKRGDGIHLYVDLPDGPSIEGIASGETSLINVLVQLGSVDEDDIIIIDNEMYSASGTKLTDLVNRINAIENKDAIQDANILAINQQFEMLDLTIDSGDDGKLAIVLNGNISPGPYPENIVTPTEPSHIHIVDFNIYENQKLTTIATELNSNSTYYGFIDPSHDSADVDNLTYGMSSPFANITFTQIERGLFKIETGIFFNTSEIIIAASLAYNTDTVSINRTFDCSASRLLEATYDGAGSDYFTASATDSSDNIYAVGYTQSEGSGGEALIIKFDSSLNKLAGKHCGGSSYEIFNGVAIDSSDNIYAVGHTQSEGTAGEALIIRFDSSLNILNKKRYGGNWGDFFTGITVDSSDNIYAVGYTTSEGQASGTYSAALIIQFSITLFIVNRKIYGGSIGESRFLGIVADSSNNLYAVGYTSAEGTSSSPIIIKFDSSLNKLLGKRYGGTSSDIFYNAAVDSNGNVYAVGKTNSEGAGSYDAIIIKFDSSLNKLAGKRYGGANNDIFYDITIDSNDNIYAVGSTTSELSGLFSTLIIQFDSSLTVLGKKRADGPTYNEFYGVTIDSNDNVYAVGKTYSNTSSYICFVMKFPFLPSGTFTGTVLTDITLSDSDLTLADSTLTLTTSSLTLAASTLTLVDTSITATDSTLTLTKDTLY